VTYGVELYKDDLGAAANTATAVIGSQISFTYWSY
jgi:hypothetical protein